jgi:serine/threonine-protein kinase
VSVFRGARDRFSRREVISGSEPAGIRPLLSVAVLANLMVAVTIGWRCAHPEHHDPLRLSGDVAVLLVLEVSTLLGLGAILRFHWRFTGARRFGPYQLLRPIGAGGMGEVYLAEHRLLKRPCAVKLIRPGSASDPQARARFEREVRLTAALSHPNTVEIYDCGRAPDGTYYYVMEYLPGLSLEELVGRYGPLPPGRVVYLLRQVLGALGEAHGVGLIHRDIKPSNIIAARRGGMDDVAKLVDFGLVRPVAVPSSECRRTGPVGYKVCRADRPDRDTDGLIGRPNRPGDSAERPGSTLTGDGWIVGTPSFMSPEQATTVRELDERSDIYSLGAVAYYLLTGRPPFERSGGTAVMAAHVCEPVSPPSRIVGTIPEDLERVVVRCLAKDPADRFAGAESLERALGACACSGDWDQDRAAHWWREVGRSAPAVRVAAAATGRAEQLPTGFGATGIERPTRGA